MKQTASSRSTGERQQQTAADSSRQQEAAGRVAQQQPIAERGVRSKSVGELEFKSRECNITLWGEHEHSVGKLLRILLCT